MTITTYRIADGKNNAAGLVDLNPQPASPEGVRYPELRVAANGAASFHGSAYLDLVWSSLERSEYNAILTACGLSQTVAHNAVTVSIRQQDDSFANYNGDAMRIQAERRERPFWKKLTVRVLNLEILAE